MANSLTDIQMKLSIVIPLYNKEKYIERCLKSLLNQDLPESDYEIVVVDDGSKDKGGELVEKMAETHRGIQFFRQKNAGPSAARNKGLAAADGDYIYFLDADDFLAPNVLKELLETAEDYRLEILEFNTKEIKEGTLPESIPHDRNPVSVIVKDGITYMADYGFRNEAWRYLVHKDLLAGTGIKFIEGTLYEDVIFTASLFLQAKRMAKVNLDIHRYVTVENSIVTSKDAAHNLRFIHGMVYAIEKMQGMIQGLDVSHKAHSRVVEHLKSRQYAFVFALLIRTFKHGLLSRKELGEILNKLSTLEAYPIDPNIGIGHGSAIHNKVFVPIFNSKPLLYTSLYFRRLAS